MDKTSPNPEQHRAIEHPGGLLLSAGAGSGKTSVLVARVLHLTENFIEKSDTTNLQNFSRDIRKYFSTMALITFTKKAAKEISMRIRTQLINNSIGSIHPEVWKIVLDAYPALTVATIHSFCFKLLSQGHFPNFDSTSEIISDPEISNKVKRLFSEWLQNNIKALPPQMSEIFLANHDNLANSLTEVFNDPALRLSWKKVNPEDIQKESLSDFLKSYFSLKGLDTLLDTPPSFVPSKKPKRWELLLGSFSELLRHDDITTPRGLTKAKNLFEQHGRISPPKGDSVQEETKIFFQSLKALKDILKDCHDDLHAFENHRKSLLESIRTITSAFLYIDKNFKRDAKLSYSDLEYYVLQGLQDDAVAQKVSKLFDHIIVDEFQDTSSVQFEIIQKIIGGDFNKLFCVGDKKQAIYGFRGGEISVFQECSNIIPKNLNLTTNYRSCRSIVKFNNLMFDFLLSQKNAAGILMVPQRADEKKDEGVVKQISVELESNDKKNLSPGELDTIEAQHIFNLILDLRSQHPASEVTILYKKLAPSRILIGHLLKQKIAFVTQVKVPRNEDPIIGIYTILLEYCLLLRDVPEGAQNFIEYPKFMLHSYFGLLAIQVPGNLTLLLEKFPQNLSLYGAEYAFCKFIHDLGLANSNHSNNLKFIESVNNFLGNDLEDAYAFLKESSEQYSIDFHFRRSDFKIKIMTAHGAKGLEFDHVILGGIHTNGVSRSSSEYFGKTVFSLKWKKSSNQKRPFKSPAYLIEHTLTSHKETAESKRLFYVACTRARKSLYWTNISHNGSEKKYSDNSWIVDIRKWLKHTGTRQKEWENIHFVNQNIQAHPDGQSRPPGRKTPASPLFHMDNMGLVEKKAKSPIIFLPQLSVTRLASITQCPRKFYLQNICRFDEKFNHMPGEADSNKNGLASNMERGLFLHDQISLMIRDNWKLPATVGEQKSQNILSWLKDTLFKSYDKEAIFSSEMAVKFPIFGHMIQGVADLVVFNDNTPIGIWDFKTGRRTNDKEIPYWFQLACYGLAFAEKYKLTQGQQIELVLAYVDQRKVIKKQVSLLKIAEQIKQEWEKLDQLDQVNTRHCPFCPYQDLCAPTSSPC